MNIKWSRMLSILRRGNIPFSTSLEGEYTEVLHIKGDSVSSARWNRLSIVAQTAYLKDWGVTIREGRNYYAKSGR